MEFVNIIVSLHNSESSDQSQSLTPGSSPLPSVPPPTNMATSFKDLIPHFFGREVSDEGQEDLAKFIKYLNFAIDGQTYR